MSLISVPENELEVIPPELEAAENDVQTLEEYLDLISGYKVGEGTYTEDVIFHVLTSRTYQEILTEQGAAFFEVPVQYFLEGENGLELSDVMVLQYKMDLKSHELTLIGAFDEEENPYEGSLEASQEAVQEYLLQTFKEIAW